MPPLNVKTQLKMLKSRGVIVIVLSTADCSPSWDICGTVHIDNLSKTKAKVGLQVGALCAWLHTLELHLAVLDAEELDVKGEGGLGGDDRRVAALACPESATQSQCLLATSLQQIYKCHEITTPYTLQ